MAALSDGPGEGSLGMVHLGPKRVLCDLIDRRMVRRHGPIVPDLSDNGPHMAWRISLGRPLAGPPTGSVDPFIDALGRMGRIERRPTGLRPCSVAMAWENVPRAFGVPKVLTIHIDRTATPGAHRSAACER